MLFLIITFVSDIRKKFFRVYLLSSFYIQAGSLGRGPALFFCYNRDIFPGLFKKFVTLHDFCDHYNY